MSATRREVLLIVCGVAACVIGILVLVGNRDWTTDALAGGLVVGGVAMIVVALPTLNGTGRRE